VATEVAPLIGTMGGRHVERTQFFRPGGSPTPTLELCSDITKHSTYTQANSGQPCGRCSEPLYGGPLTTILALAKSSTNATKLKRAMPSDPHRSADLAQGQRNKVWERADALYVLGGVPGSR
jgi:hypothetical protein